MEDLNKPNPYNLDELIMNMEKVWSCNNGQLNIPRAFYTLALEIKDIKEWQKTHTDEFLGGH